MRLRAITCVLALITAMVLPPGTALAAPSGARGSVFQGARARAHAGSAERVAGALGARVAAVAGAGTRTLVRRPTPGLTAPAPRAFPHARGVHVASVEASVTEALWYADAEDSQYVDCIVEGVGTAHSPVYIQVAFWDVDDNLVQVTGDFAATYGLAGGQHAVFTMVVDPPVEATQFSTGAWAGDSVLGGPATLSAFDGPSFDGPDLPGQSYYTFTVAPPGYRRIVGLSEATGTDEPSATFADTNYWVDGDTAPDVPTSGDTYGAWNPLMPGTTIFPTAYAEARTDAVDFGRDAGNSRYGTAISISGDFFASAGTVVIATGAGFADALSAASLAGAVGGPLLLTRPESLDASIPAEIARLGATKAYIVGGTGAVSSQVESTLRNPPLSLDVVRIAGVSRYGTSAAVCSETAGVVHDAGGNIDNIILARGDGFADALSASPISCSSVAPILLVKPTQMQPETAGALQALVDYGDLTVEDPGTVIVAGGTNAVSDAVADQATDPGGLSWIRVAGGDRYETSEFIAEYGLATGHLLPTDFGIANGQDFPDALAGGVAVGNHSGPLVLTRSDDPGETGIFTVWMFGHLIEKARVFGGTKAVDEWTAEIFEDAARGAEGQ